MINGLIGKLQKDKTVEYIYCHDKADMTQLGEVLLQNYSSEEAVSELLQKGHCHFPGNATKNTWELANKKQYKAGDAAQHSFSKKDFLELAIEDVQTVYLFEKGKWKYANALSACPAFVAVRPSAGANFKTRERKFKKCISSAWT